MKMRSKMQNEKGFTLVELMVVVVILGILVAIAVPVYNSVTDKAKISAIEANLRTIDGAIMMYGSNNDGDFSAIDQAKLTAGYLQVWPDSPGQYVIDTTTDAKNPKAKVTTSEDIGKVTKGTYTLSEFIKKANS